MVEDRARHAGLSFEFDVPAGLPRLRADARALKQILLNLLANAIKFTPAGGRVALAARLEPGGIALTVTDTGIGIAADQLPNIVHPFTQIDSSLTRAHGGTGLGLPIAKALTELHGGTLAIASTPGQGTAVTVDLPATRLLRQAA
jgi:signal transduction histidine kinase